MKIEKISNVTIAANFLGPYPKKGSILMLCINNFHLFVYFIPGERFVDVWFFLDNIFFRENGSLKKYSMAPWILFLNGSQASYHNL